MKLLRPLTGYTLHDHKANDFIRRELKTTGILGKLDEYRLNWNLHLQRMPQTEYRSNHTTTDHKEGAQLEDQRNVDENSFNSGDGTDQTGPILNVCDDDDDHVEHIRVHTPRCNLQYFLQFHQLKCVRHRWVSNR